MTQDLFDEELELPDLRTGRRLEGLVGLDSIIDALTKNASVLLDPKSLEDWNRTFHGGSLTAASALAKRTPLFIFAGDVGTGKTTLAESFGQKVAKERSIDISVLRLSLRTRGTGAVGEMTKLLGSAFDEVIRRGRKMKKGSALIVVIDEADAIAQSRELDQMHHEDRAGVNALIRGIDNVAAEGLPIVVVMCTNRLDAIDPAVRRRAAAEFQFMRPGEAQCLNIFSASLQGSGISAEELSRLAKQAQDDGRGYGHTYSDLVHRVIPAAILAAYPKRALVFSDVVDAVEAHAPTPPFKSA